VRMPDGSFLYAVDSTAFDAMGHADFTDYLAKAQSWVAETFGIVWPEPDHPPQHSTTQHSTTQHATALHNKR